MAKSNKPHWRCPKCGREFVFRTREHSCNVSSVAEHLAKTTPEVRELYGEMERWLERLDGCKITPLKTAIGFSARVVFGGVMVQKKALQLNVFLDRAVKDRRVHNVSILGPNKFCNHIKLQSTADFDDQVRTWLQAAHALAMR